MLRIIVAVLLLTLCCSGCRTITMDSTVSMAPNTHGHYVPNYNVRLTIR